MQIRLYDLQVEYIKHSPGKGKIISEAYKRYSDGKMHDFVAHICKKRKNNQKVPQLSSFSVKKRFPVKDSILREILRYHIEVPDLEQMAIFQKEKEKLDSLIESELKVLSGVVFLEK